MKERDVHPFLSLEMVAIKKNEYPDYQAKDGEDVSLDRMSKSEAEEYYEFLKEIIFEFLDNNIELKEKYDFMIDMFDLHVTIDTSDILSSEEFHG